MASEWANGGSPAESEDPGGPEAELGASSKRSSAASGASSR